MLSVLMIGTALVAFTVAIHAAGLGWVLAHLMSSQSALPTRLRPIAWMLVRVAWLLILIHSAEISIWALFFWWEGCLPDAESSFYFSGVTYTTIGYGDLVLIKPWRILAPIEGATGILMCGLSAGLFFATVTRIYSPRIARSVD
jgi:hypothetical protein